MEGLRAKARRLLREIARLIVPYLNLDDEISEFVDTVVDAAVDEAMRVIASKLAAGR